MRSKWTAADIPALTGRTAIVTGASSGLGYAISLQLAAHGAHVVLASRHQVRTEEAARLIKTAVPEASIEAQVVDLADLASVRRFADEFSQRHRGLDMLVNNAGISGGPRRLTVDGYEAHFQINYLGPFALTGLLLPALRARTGARVVTMSSDVAAQGKIDFDDLQGAHTYRFIKAYAQSKLADLLFALELDRRSQVAGLGITSLAAHPGIAKSNIFIGKEADWGRSRRGSEQLLRLAQLLLAQPTARAALPALYQATDPAATSAEYVGPSRGMLGGYPAISKLPASAQDQRAAQRLWEVGEALTGVSYKALSRRS